MLSANVFNHDKKELSPEFDHMTLLVHLDKDYLADIGFGDSFRKQIEIPTGESEDISGYYKVFNIDSNRYELQRKEDEEWKLQYTFTTIPRKFSDFKKICDFQQDSPTSHFRTRTKCTIATLNWRITLSDCSLTIKENELKTKQIVQSRYEFRKILE